MKSVQILAVLVFFFLVRRTEQRYTPYVPKSMLNARDKIFIIPCDYYRPGCDLNPTLTFTAVVQKLCIVDRLNSRFRRRYLPGICKNLGHPTSLRNWKRMTGYNKEERNHVCTNYKNSRRALHMETRCRNIGCSLNEIENYICRR